MANKTMIINEFNQISSKSEADHIFSFVIISQMFLMLT